MAVDKYHTEKESIILEVKDAIDLAKATLFMGFEFDSLPGYFLLLCSKTPLVSAARIQNLSIYSQVYI